MPREPVSIVVPSGFNDRAVLAVCRALERRSHPFSILGRGDRDAIRRTSHARHLVGDVGRELDLDEWLAALRDVPRPALILPMSEFLNRWLLVHRAALEEAGLRPALGPRDAYLRLSDKSSFATWATEAGLPLPAVVPGSVETAALPFAAKPRVEYDADGTGHRPWLIESEADRAAFQASEEPDAYTLQRLVDGSSWYVLAHVAGDGEVRWAVQRNAAQQPGGRSIVAAWSAAPPPEEELPVADIVAALSASGHHGMVMVEVKCDAQGPALIEANPRPWGPLQLTLDADTGLVDAWLDDLLGRPRTPPRAPAVGVPYLWLGGIAATRGQRGRLRWFAGGRRYVRQHAASFATRDVHLRADSWREAVHQLREAGT